MTTTLSTPGTARARRLPALDGLRGVAALTVLVHHALLTGWPAAHGRQGVGSGGWWVLYSPLHLLWDGTFAVAVFFVLSGLVLAVLAERASFRWSSYYPGRLLRLYLPVWGAAALTLAVIALVPRSPQPAGSDWLSNHSGTTGHVTAGKVLQLFALFPDATWLNTALWSLRWEVVFSLALPLFLLAARDRRLTWLVLSAALLALPIGQATGRDSLVYLPRFLLGVLIAQHRDSLVTLAARPRVAGLTALAAFAGWWAYWLAESERTRLPHSDALLAALADAQVIAAALVAALAVSWRPLVQALSAPAARWLGTLSFSLYLIHEPLVVAVANTTHARSVWLTLLLAVPLALGLAYVFHRLVEGPSHRLSQTLTLPQAGRVD